MSLFLSRFWQDDPETNKMTLQISPQIKNIFTFMYKARKTKTRANGLKRSRKNLACLLKTEKYYICRQKQPRFSSERMVDILPSKIQKVINF